MRLGRVLGQVGRHDRNDEPLALVGSPVERTDDTNTAQPFAEDEVQPIDLLLHPLREGQRPLQDDEPFFKTADSLLEDQPCPSFRFVISH